MRALRVDAVGDANAHRTRGTLDGHFHTRQGRGPARGGTAGVAVDVAGTPLAGESLQVAHLAAEPLWITAARNGRSVFARHPTRARGPPSYRRLDDATPEDSLESWRGHAKAALARTDVDVMNGYNERFPPHIISA